jgi:predicted  nucleic acid-binding Zn-ribbon protein
LSFELAALDARLHELDLKIWEAINRQRYSRRPEDVERAADDLKKLVSEMDRLMTRSRAVEGKLLLLQKSSERQDGSASRASPEPNDPADPLRVEVYRDLPETTRRG